MSHTYRYPSNGEVASRYPAYQAARAAGRPLGMKHEQLRTCIAVEIGPVTSEFFDQERELPPVTSGLAPWPMDPRRAYGFQCLRLIVLACGTLAGIFIASVWVSFPAVLLVGILIGAGAVGLMQLAALAFKPKDLAHRHAQGRKYQLMRDQVRSEEDKAAYNRRIERLRIKHLG